MRFNFPLFSFKRKDNYSKIKLKPATDLLKLIKVNQNIFVSLENNLTHKEEDEIRKEISLGIKISKLNFNNISQKKIIIIPPKYDFWIYYFLAINLVHSGYSVKFYYHNWTRKIIDLLKPFLSYLSYQTLEFHNLDDSKIIDDETSLYLNFYDNYSKLRKIHSFSTALVTKDVDLDYAVAYILSNAFSLAGIKTSNLKRIIVDEEIKEEFQNKLSSRLSIIPEINSAIIRSKFTRERIHNLVSEAISDGAELVFGGSEFDNEQYQNMILNDVPKESRIYQKKFYGPVLLTTYTKFTKRNLIDYLKQQPSKGLIIFSNSSKFLDLNEYTLRHFSVAVRPQLEENKYNLIIENYPNIELMFYRLGLI